MIKFNLNLKDPHLEVINDLKAKFSITSNKEMINRCITSALNLNKDDQVETNPIVKIFQTNFVYH